MVGFIGKAPPDPPELRRPLLEQYLQACCAEKWMDVLVECPSMLYRVCSHAVQRTKVQVLQCFLLSPGECLPTV